MPDINNKNDFEKWLKTIKGKFVLVSRYQPTGRTTKLERICTRRII